MIAMLYDGFERAALEAVHQALIELERDFVLTGSDKQIDGFKRLVAQ